MAGVAAEAEYVSDDVLMIHRTVFVGSSMLDVYAEDPRGAFRTWYHDGQGEPFWHVVTGIDDPAFLRYGIDALGVSRK